VIGRAVSYWTEMSARTTRSKVSSGLPFQGENPRSFLKPMAAWVVAPAPDAGSRSNWRIAF
jgi:predicted HD phosphohydrolase